jgi:hypothetical protein
MIPKELVDLRPLYEAAVKLGGRVVWPVDSDKLREVLDRLAEGTREWALANLRSTEQKTSRRASAAGCRGALEGHAIETL